MLTLFVLPSGAKNADLDKTVGSFKSITPIELVTITDWREVNGRSNNSWMGIFWDNEGLGIDLAEALPFYFENPTYDALLCYKYINKENASYRMRFFRRHVHLMEDFKPLQMFMKVETILDGFVKSHENLRLVHRE